MKRRVVVTGLGAITPIGNDVESFWNGIKAGKVGIGEITKFDTSEYKVKLAAEVKGFVAKEHMDFKSAKRMELFSQYAVAASLEALKDAGIDMEIAGALAEYLGVELVVQNMDFDAVCLSVGQHKCDVAMAGLTVKPDREEYVTFSDSYYSASQQLIVTSDDTEFDSCKTADDVNAILAAKDSKVKIGVQNGTTGQFYVEGDADWGFTGFAAQSVGYKSGSLAVQDLLNGNIQYVIIDAAPAKCITEAINKMQ